MRQRLYIVVTVCLYGLSALAQDTIQLSDPTRAIRQLNKSERKILTDDVSNKTGLSSKAVSSALDSLADGNTITITRPAGREAPSSPSEDAARSPNKKDDAKKSAATQKERDKVYRVLSDANPPLMLKQANPTEVPGLTYTRKQAVPPAVLLAAHSVGQVLSEAGDFKGTAWIVGPDLIATNCHVVIEMRDETDEVARDKFRLRFTDDENPREFLIHEVAYYSTIPGFDIALLRVAKHDLTNRTALPKALHLGLLTRPPMDIFAIGYANALAIAPDPTTERFRQRIASFGSAVKLIGNGIISAVTHEDGYDVFSHSAATLWGNSGSPLLDAEGNVIAVHYCCNVVEPVAHARTCNSNQVESPLTNLAIGSAAVWKLLDQFTDQLPSTDTVHVNIPVSGPVSQALSFNIHRTQ